MNIRILVLGDFQGVFPAKLKKKLEKEEFDLVVAVGDYAGIDEWRPYIMHALSNSRKGEEITSPEKFFGKKEFKKLLKKDFEAGKKVLSELNKLGKPVILIFGNSDDGWYNYPFIRLLNSEKKKVNFIKKLRNIKNTS
ncbi:metallophosphoesterase [Candidatus Pacearchaeota archaeon]|nr:metallophosphoesterase [Candidatus Pacearchaeota archaeon]